MRHLRPRRSASLILAVFLALICYGKASPTNTVRIQSKTVLKGETGVQLGVYFSNESNLCLLQLPLEIRSVSDGAYISGVFTFDVFPYGRIPGSQFEDHQDLNYYNTPQAENTCSGPVSQTWANPSNFPNADGSPDAFLWTAISLFDYFPSGEDYDHPSFTLSFDVGDAVGSFEIDTMCAVDGLHLLFIDEASNGITPSFVKGVVTVVAGERGNWPACACPNPDGVTQDVITSAFGPRNWNPWYHDAIDIRRANNDPVHAILGGTVVERYHQTNPEYGWYITTESAAIDQSGVPRRFFVLYHHMYSPLVQKGQTVQKGQVVGTCWDLPNLDPHVHLETKYDYYHPVHPVRFLNKPEMRCPVVMPGWSLVNAAGGGSPPYDYLLCTALSQKSEKIDLTAIHVWSYKSDETLGRKAVINFENASFMKNEGPAFPFFAGTDHEVTITLTPWTLDPESEGHKIDIRVDPAAPFPSGDWVGLAFQDVSATPCSTLAMCFTEPSLLRLSDPSDGYCTAIGNISGYSPGMLLEFFDGYRVNDHVELLWRGTPGIPANGVRILRSTNGAPEEVVHKDLLRFHALSSDTVTYSDYAVAEDDRLVYRLAIQFPTNNPVFAEQTVHLGASISEAAPLPRSFALRQNYPNPFNAGTNITFALDSTNIRSVTLSVFNILGQQVATLFSEAMARPGRYTVQWDGRDEVGRPTASGVYFCRLRTATSQATKRMVLIR